MSVNLIGVDKLEKCVSDFVKPFGLTAKLDTDFAYYYEKDLITFSIFDIIANDLFLIDAESRFPNLIGVPSFIWCTMHEVGHQETWDDLTDEELEESTEIKKNIDTDSTSSKMTYFTCPDEYAATEWAGNYIESHREEIDEFWKSFLKALVEFYTVNHITED